ncbi:MAG: HI0074 family nucleotidyltransferase substrate-binding subunit [Thermodesulforhabdaceae bacterium]
MGRLEKLISDFARALTRLDESVSKTEQYKLTGEYSFYRDSSIQRFEFTFEIFWKTLRAFLERDGIICRSPRSCIREFFSLGLISEEEIQILFRMLEDRNLTVHTYLEEIAEEIYSRLGEYVGLLKDIKGKIESYK